jgi:hypothetical protein
VPPGRVRPGPPAGDRAAPWNEHPFSFLLRRGSYPAHFAGKDSRESRLSVHGQFLWF